MSFTLRYAKTPKKITEVLETLIALHDDGALSVLDDEEILRVYEQDMRDFQIAPQLEVHAVKQEPLLGQGVFLCPDEQQMDKHEFIGIYSGKSVLRYDTEDFNGEYTFEQLNITLKRKKRKIIKDLGLNPPEDADELTLYVDALHEGNFARFINNSSHPNVEAIVELVRGKPEVVYRASRTIYPGEQLLVDYTSSYWKPIGVVPLPIESDTYMLAENGNVVTGEAFYMKKDALKQLAKHTSLISPKRKGRAIQVSPQLKKQLKYLSGYVKERHIHPKLLLEREKGRYELKLRPGKRINKGECLGIYSTDNFFKFAIQKADGHLHLKKCSVEKEEHLLVYAKKAITGNTPLTLDTR